MPSLREFCRQTGIKARRWTEVYCIVRERKKMSVKLSEWQEDYSYEAQEQAIRDGFILKPVPDGWVRIRDLAEDMGGKEAVPWFLGSGEQSAQVVRDAGIFDRCRMDIYYELWCTGTDAGILRAYAQPKWDGRR